MHAYCFASGHIEFGRSIPDGALPIARGPAKRLRDFIEPLARHGYQSQTIDGRLAKVPGTDTLLVPGIPEAPNQSAALDALEQWLAWIGKNPPTAIAVHK